MLLGALSSSSSLLLVLPTGNCRPLLFPQSIKVGFIFIVVSPLACQPCGVSWRQEREWQTTSLPSRTSTVWLYIPAGGQLM